MRPQTRSPGDRADSGGRLASRRPLLAQQAIVEPVDPLATAKLVLAQQTLALHAELLEHAHRRDIARVDAGPDLLDVEGAEGVVHGRAGRLGGQSQPPPRPADPVAERNDSIFAIDV